MIIDTLKQTHADLGRYLSAIEQHLAEGGTVKETRQNKQAIEEISSLGKMLINRVKELGLEERKRR